MVAKRRWDPVTIGLVCVLVFAPFAIGSVHLITSSLLWAGVFVLCLLHLWRNDLSYRSRSYIRRTKTILLLYAFFIAFSLFQILPLPQAVVRSLSPSALSLYEKLGLTTGRVFLPLSVSTDHTLRALIKWITYGCLFFLTCTLSSARGRDEHFSVFALLFTVVVLVGFAEALYGMYLYLNAPDAILWFRRPSRIDAVAGTFVNRNHFAAYLNISLFVCLGGFLHHAEMKRRDPVYRATMMYIYGLAFLVMFLSLIFSKSRMGQLSFLCGVMVLFMLYGARRSPIYILVTIAIIILGVGWAISRGVGPVIERWLAIDKDFPSRALVWETTLSMVRSFLLTGTGLGTYVLAYPSFKPQSLGATVFDHAHNDYIELLAECGIVGLGLSSVFLFLFYFFSIRAWLGKDSSFSRHMGAAGIAATFTTLFHSIAEFNFHIPAVGATFFTVLGMTWGILLKNDVRERNL